MDHLLKHSSGTEVLQMNHLRHRPRLTKTTSQHLKLQSERGKTSMGDSPNWQYLPCTTFLPQDCYSPSSVTSITRYPGALSNPKLGMIAIISRTIAASGRRQRHDLQLAKLEEIYKLTKDLLVNQSERSNEEQWQNPNFLSAATTGKRTIC